MKNKGQVYPSESDSLSILNLLPAAILALTPLLSQQEQEVLAYMITRSTTFSNKNKSFNKKTTHHHNPPLFHCECFHCYTTYWFRWDSSPNRELIHQAIEAFEDHLNTTQQQHQQLLSKKKGGKKRDNKSTARKPQTPPPEVELELELRSQSEVLVTTVVGGGGGGVTAVSQQKGLARRVLPDVLGLLNSRWWSLWSPNV